MRSIASTTFILGLGIHLLGGFATAADSPPQPLIPHAQDKPPNDPRDAVTAAKLMTVPEGFTVEVVAAEPDLVNPVAMAIDDRGRFWVTESIEYPRREPGVGKDRVKILEDTDGDGKADRFTVFLEGLNIPSGIAVGHGGVWVVNSPDLLFVQDTDGDGKADRQEVVVTGFGRTDTHELPNSLTWGPDGWLYGLNGVFNHSHVHYSKTNPNYQENHPGWPLTCALFRIHPRTREFQVFCEGTSNPWGIAFNDEGETFISACVIDHLWHLVETGYYHRQGGPYPPFTWKIESIVKHKHQKAAYCGIHFFDSDSYPEKYRRKLYMGNIHGGCLNVDHVVPAGSTYQGFGEPDFLTANDAWFMPVVQKTGPDGSLYVLDWYDRYHCYQDANRDPAGLDRLKGRLYRVRYQETPRPPKGFDLAKESDEQLIERLGSANDFLRDSARRLLQERNTPAIQEGLMARLEKPASGAADSSPPRHRVFMTLCGLSLPPTARMQNWSPEESDTTIRNWQLRFWGDHTATPVSMEQLKKLAIHETDLREQRQLVTTAAKRFRATVSPNTAAPNEVQDLFQIFIAALDHAGDDPVLSRVVWQNLHPVLEHHAETFLELLKEPDITKNPGLLAMMPRIMDRLLGRKNFDAKPVAMIIEMLAQVQPESAAMGLGQLSLKVQNREFSAESLAAMKQALKVPLQRILAGPPDSPLYLPAAFLGTSWNDPLGINAVRAVFLSESKPQDQRLLAFNALVTARDAGLIETVATTFDSSATTPGFQSQLLASLSKHDAPQIADVILSRYEKLDPELQPRAIELLTQRATWAKTLLTAIGQKKLAATTINLNQARRLKDLNDEQLTNLLTTHWGQVRTGRDPNREQYIASMRQLIRTTHGDPFAGEKAFKKVCAQCHKIYGEGAEVGPDITLNGRNHFEQLLSNVFDPSLVIGAGYRSYTVVTVGGRVLNGLLAEESPQRVVLKVQGGKQEVIPRADIEEFKVNEISLMPEQLEKQLTPLEIADLFAFLSLDKHPSDKSARKLAGAGEIIPKETTKSAEFASLVAEILPGFTTTAAGEGGIAILKSHFDRAAVLRTHPVSPEKPCTLSATVAIPPNKKTRLVLEVSHHQQGDWLLQVRANGEQVLKEDVNAKSCAEGWGTFTVDLSKFAGKEVRLELMNRASGWSNEFGYWGAALLISE